VGWGRKNDRPVAAVASEAKKITTATFDGAYFDGIAKILSEQFAPVVESFEGEYYLSTADIEKIAKPID
jgi:hypothetical protein